MFTLRLFGGAILEGEHGVVRGQATQSRRLALLALIATAPNGRLSRDKLIAYLWPDCDVEQGRHRLNESLYVLRKALGTDAILSEGDAVRLNVDQVSSDVLEFSQALKRQDLERAVSLYAGPFLDGFFLKGAPEFESWVESERRHLADRYQEALESLAESAEATEDLAEAVRQWKRLAAHDPFNSRFALSLMRAMAAVGDPANAIRHAEEHMRLVERDLGVQPRDDLLTLVEQIRRQSLPPEPTSDGLHPTDVAIGEPLLEAAPACQARAVRGRVVQRPWIFTWRSAQVALLAAVVISAIIVAVWQSVPRGARQTTPASAAVDPANRIAVLPFEYSGDEESAYLGSGLAMLLSTAIDGAGELTAVDPFALVKYVEREYAELDPQQGEEIARRFGAGLFILGSILEAGGSYRASATLYDLRRGRLADAEVAVGDEARVLYELVPKLARRLLIERYAGAANRLARVGIATTQSLDALKVYLQGEAYARAGVYDSAYVAYRRAVELDTTFALAYYRSATNVWGGGGQWNEEALENARRFSAGLSERDSLLIDAVHAWRVRDNWEEAEHLYGRVVSRYPDELDAWGRLGDLLYFRGHKRGRPVTELRRVAEKALALDPFDFLGNDQLAAVAAFEGDFETAAATRERMLEIHPQGTWSLQFRTMLGSLRGDADGLDRALEALRAAPNVIIWATGEWLFQQAEDLDAARRVYEILTELDRPSDWRATGYSYLIWLELARGRWQAAQREIAALRTLRPNRPLWAAWLHPAAPVTTEELIQLRDSIARWHPDSFADTVVRSFYLGRVHNRLGEPELAEAVAVEMEATAASRDLDAGQKTVAGNVALTLRAQAARARRQPEEALSYLSQIEAREAWFDREAMHAFERWLRAEVLYSLGRYHEARDWYEGFGIIDAYDHTLLAPARLRLGNIYERLDDPEKAASHYNRFLQRWKDCDPELRPQVEAAKRVLERLATERAGG
ncbi:MAG: BTAD domain-containing putative transcriptional regulator [Gemmatimonadales bacterium]|jgi:DNA-binding SARP family transcriptional activator